MSTSEQPTQRHAQAIARDNRATVRDFIRMPVPRPSNTAAAHDRHCYAGTEEHPYIIQ